MFIEWAKCSDKQVHSDNKHIMPLHYWKSSIEFVTTNRNLLIKLQRMSMNIVCACTSYLGARACVCVCVCNLHSVNVCTTKRREKKHTSKLFVTQHLAQHRLNTSISWWCFFSLLFSVCSIQAYALCVMNNFHLKRARAGDTENTNILSTT